MLYYVKSQVKIFYKISILRNTITWLKINLEQRLGYFGKIWDFMYYEDIFSLFLTLNEPEKNYRKKTRLYRTIHLSWKNYKIFYDIYNFFFNFLLFFSIFISMVTTKYKYREWKKNLMFYKCVLRGKRASLHRQLFYGWLDWCDGKRVRQMSQDEKNSENEKNTHTHIRENRQGAGNAL